MTFGRVMMKPHGGTAPFSALLQGIQIPKRPEHSDHTESANGYPAHVREFFVKKWFDFYETSLTSAACKGHSLFTECGFDPWLDGTLFELHASSTSDPPMPLCHSAVPSFS